MGDGGVISYSIIFLVEIPSVILYLCVLHIFCKKKFREQWSSQFLTPVVSNGFPPSLREPHPGIIDLLSYAANLFIIVIHWYPFGEEYFTWLFLTVQIARYAPLIHFIGSMLVSLGRFTAVCFPTFHNKVRVAVGNMFRFGISL